MPLQFHLQPPDLLEELSLLSLPLVLVFAFLPPDKQLAGAVHQLPLALSHQDPKDGVSGSDSWMVLRPLIVSIATFCLYSELWVWCLLIGGRPHFLDGAPPHRLTIDPVKESQTT